MMRIRLATFTLVVASMLISSAGQAEAQTVPFGKNKIQYRNIDWQVLSGEHLHVYDYPAEQELAKLALSYGEESYSLLERKFQHHPFRRIPLIIYAADHDFEQTNLFPGFIPEGVLGFTEYLKRRVALPFRGDYEQFRSTLRHELVHAFQLSKLSEVAAQNPRAGGATPQQIHWFTEGLAEYWSGEQTTEDDMYIRDMALNGALPTIQEFSRTYSYFSYPLGAELHKYLAERFGEEYIVQMYEQYPRYASFEALLAGVLGVDLDRLSIEFKYALEQRYFPVYAQRSPLAIGSRPVITKGGANYKPVIYAPAGGETQLLFMSPRNGYTNLYMTPLAAGEKDLEAVLKGERSAEFESFHAFESGFDVSSDGVVVLGSKFLDRDALMLWDIETRDVVGRYQWPELVGIRSPAFDPTGHRVVFEALSMSGTSDLYILDFDTQRLRRLTNDHYRDADPDWSPDGRTVVFASDRTDNGEFGSTNLFLLDVETGAIRNLTRGLWKDQTPRWSNDGSRIAFTSDRSGSYDLYVTDSSGTGTRITQMTGGAYDPEWLPDDSGLMFAGYSQRSFQVYQYDFAGHEPFDRIALAEPAAAAPPPWTWQGVDTVEVEAREYRPLNRMSLDFAAADAMVAPGFGSAQGAQFLMSDMLGDHILFVGVSASQFNKVTNLADNLSGSALYLNLSHRLNYGAAVFRFRGRYRDVAFDVYDEESYGGYVIGSYPLSKFRRIEMQLGLQSSNRVDVDDGIQAGLIRPTTDLVDRDLTRRGYLANNFVSYVKDNTLWLETGPIDGERFNLSLGMVACFECASVSAVTGRVVERGAAAENWAALVDYRHYYRTSLRSAYAIRAYGYYSDGALPGRSVLGGPHRLRGYPYYSLAGSRVGLLNQEWRFPILTGIGLGFPFGTLRLPGIQGAAFLDAGTSTLEDQPVGGLWGSYGAGFRSSLGAPLVLRMDVGRRFAHGDRPPVIFSNGERFKDTFVDFFIGFNY
jgi:hypothetical protein